METIDSDRSMILPDMPLSISYRTLRDVRVSYVLFNFVASIIVLSLSQNGKCASACVVCGCWLFSGLIFATFSSHGCVLNSCVGWLCGRGVVSVPGGGF